MQALLGLIAGSILSLLSAAVIGLAHLRDQSRRLQIILLGQLRNLEDHCSVSEKNLREGKRELILRLRMARYGEISSLNEAMTKVGNLDEKIIQDLIKLSLYIRNNDIEISCALERIDTGDDKIDLNAIAHSLAYTAKYSANLAGSVKAIKLPFLWPLQRQPGAAARIAALWHNPRSEE